MWATYGRPQANIKHLGAVGWQPAALTATNVGYIWQASGQHKAFWGCRLATYSTYRHLLMWATYGRPRANIKHFGAVGWQPAALTGTNVGYKWQGWGLPEVSFGCRLATYKELMWATYGRPQANIKHLGAVGWQPTALTGTNVGYKWQGWGQHIATWGHSLAGSGRPNLALFVLPKWDVTSNSCRAIVRHWGVAINCQPRTQPANHPGVGFSFTWVEVTCQGKFSWCWVTCTLQKHEETMGFETVSYDLAPAFVFAKWSTRCWQYLWQHPACSSQPRNSSVHRALGYSWPWQRRKWKMFDLCLSCFIHYSRIDFLEDENFKKKWVWFSCFSMFLPSSMKNWEL